MAALAAAAEMGRCRQKALPARQVLHKQQSGVEVRTGTYGEETQACLQCPHLPVDPTSPLVSGA